MILKDGTKVLIFHRCEIEKDYIDEYIQGKVIKSELSHDLSNHGSPWYVINYTVLGEDGKNYFGNYGRPTLGDYFFMTTSDYKNYLKMISAEKEFEIEKLKIKTEALKEILSIIDKCSDTKE